MRGRVLQKFLQFVVCQIKCTGTSRKLLIKYHIVKPNRKATCLLGVFIYTDKQRWTSKACLSPFSNVTRVLVSRLYIHKCSSKNFMNENFLNRMKLWVTVTSAWHSRDYWLLRLTLNSRAVEIPFFRECFPTSFFKFNAEGRDKWHVTKMKWHKKLYLENMKRETTWES
jgi:hypothetical protein